MRMFPATIRHLIFPKHEHALQRPTFRYLKDLRRTQWLPREQLELLQGAKLRALLSIAFEHCPWHARRLREAGLNVSSDEPIAMEEFRRVPTMTKDDARAHLDQLVWRGVPGGYYRYNTGGSSGSPLVFYYGRLRQASDAAGRMRARSWWGVEVGDPEVYLWGAPVELAKTDRIKTVRDRLLNQLVLNAFEMTPSAMDSYARTMSSFSPMCVYGYASSLALLAAHVRERGIRMSLPRLRVVCATGEPLYANQRALIQEVFGAPVANEFGSRDIGFTAHESPEGQVLLMSESIFLEVLDPQGNPVKEGELGEAVVTGLCSHAQPFIRYRTGDMVRVSHDQCPAGRGLHVLSEILGRTTDFVIRTDGAIMHALSVIYVVREVEGVKEFKFIQHTVDRVEVLVVPNDRWCAEMSKQIRYGLSDRLGPEVMIEITVVDHIAADASGKYRYVVSHAAFPQTVDVARARAPSETAA